MGWVPSGFYVDLCAALDFGVTSNRMDGFTFWQVAEGPNRGDGGAKHNPFNIILKAHGSTDFNDNNGSPVQNYLSRRQGVHATASVLKQGNYLPILSALRDDADPYYLAVTVHRAGEWTDGWLFCQVLHDHGVGAG